MSAKTEILFCAKHVKFLQYYSYHASMYISSHA